MQPSVNKRAVDKKYIQAVDDDSRIGSEMFLWTQRKHIARMLSKIGYFLSSLKTGEPSQNQHPGHDASWQQRGVRATACYNRSEAAFTATDP